MLTPNDFASLDEVEERLRLYEVLTNREPRPFDWRFDRGKLLQFLKRLDAHRHDRSASENDLASQRKTHAA